MKFLVKPNQYSKTMQYMEAPNEWWDNLLTNPPVIKDKDRCPLAIFGTPVALATYTMSFNMEGDAEFAGQIVFLSTAVSVFTLFLWIYFLKSMGAV